MTDNLGNANGFLAEKAERTPDDLAGYLSDDSNVAHGAVESHNGDVVLRLIRGRYWHPTGNAVGIGSDEGHTSHGSTVIAADATVFTLLRCQRGSRVVGETAPLHVATDGTVAINCDVKFNIGRDVDQWNSAVNQPLTITLVETNRKRKAPFPVSSRIVVIDIMQLLFGKTIPETWFKLFPREDLAPEDNRNNMRMPEVLLSLTGFDGSTVLPEAVSDRLNALVITIDGYYGLSNRLTDPSLQCQYSTGFRMADGKTTESAECLIKRGFCTDSRPMFSRKFWNTSDSLTNEDDFIPTLSKFSFADCRSPVDQTLSGYYHGDNVQMEYLSSGSTRLNILTEIRFIFDDLTVENFKKFILEKENLIFELFVKKHYVVKKKKKTSESDTIEFQHGVSIVPLGYLLYPGMSSFKGRYCLNGFDAAFYSKLTDCESLFAPQTTSPGSMAMSADFMDRSSVMETTTEESSKLTVSGQTPSNVEVPNERNLSTVSDESVFTPGKSFLVVHLDMLRPLVSKVSDQKLNNLVKSMLSQNDLPTREEDKLDAVKSCRLSLKTLRDSLMLEAENLNIPEKDVSVKKLLTEFIGTAEASDVATSVENSLYDMVKSLSNMDHFKTGTKNEPNSEILSRVHLFVLQQMRWVFEEQLDTRNDPVPTAVHASTDDLKYYAEECCLVGYPEKAQQYYLERIGVDAKSYEFWYDYGEFCLLMDNLQAAETCFKRTVQIDSEKHRGLLMLAISLSLQLRNEEANNLFDYLTRIRGQCFLTYCVQAIHLALNDSNIGYELSLKASLRLFTKTLLTNQLDTVLSYDHAVSLQVSSATVFSEKRSTQRGKIAGVQKSMDSESHHKRRTSKSRAALVNNNQSFKSFTNKKLSNFNGEISLSEEADTVTRSVEMMDRFWLTVAQFLDNCKAYLFSRYAMEKITASESNYVPNYFVMKTRTELYTEGWQAAEDLVTEGLKMYPHNSQLRASVGWLRMRYGDLESSQSCLELALEYASSHDDSRIVHLCLGMINYVKERYKKARRHFFAVVNVRRTPFTWLWLGKTCYRLGHYYEAEQALKQSVMLDNLCGETWAYLCLINLKKERLELFRETYKWAVRLKGFSDSLLAEIHVLQREYTEYSVNSSSLFLSMD